MSAQCLILTLLNMNQLSLKVSTKVLNHIQSSRSLNQEQLALKIQSGESDFDMLFRLLSEKPDNEFVFTYELTS